MNTAICVIGSSNTDMVVKTDRLPVPGETVIGGTFLMNPGGKGANQAVAAARLGASVVFVGKVGNDIFGQQALSQFQREGIDSSFVFTDPENPSGVALINVDAAGENCIAVAPGSNGNLTPDEVGQAVDALPDSSLVLIQLEIPLPTVERAIRQSYKKGLRVILNPAPAQPLSPALFRYLYLITPNETEAELLTGIRVTDVATAEKAAQQFHEAGIPNVVITLGSRGAYLHTNTVARLIPAPAVSAVDSTAAGDCFNGALAVALSENRPLDEAVAFACKAAAFSVTRMGAQASMPDRNEVDEPKSPN
ncbi:ribokinase [Larkinella terrae]|uniref:Ribokinase n=1 Tax=Larkinella terrae TaxID=2025311 RepID=A0A7K0EE33_9BACT|nr:ribokinase [Larkinella terrae]MRS59962.1 ribokinase [Larkinella terrae]